MKLTQIVAEKKLHYGWIIVFACFLLTTASTSILINCVGLFIKPVSAALHFERGDFSLYCTCISLGTVVLSPTMGALIQKKSHKHIIMVCAIGAAAALFTFSRCNHLWQFYLTAFICGFFTVGLTTISMSSMINRWFAKKRGVALGFVFAGSGIGSMLLTPITSYIISEISWRTAFQVLAVILVLTNLTVAPLLLQNSPADIGLFPYGYGGETATRGDSTPVISVPSITKGQATKQKAFWTLSIFLGLLAIGAMGTQQNLTAYLTDIGYSVSDASLCLSMVMGWLMVGKILFGWFFDTFGSQKGTVVIITTLVLAQTLLLYAKQRPAMIMFSIAFGLSYSVLSIAPSCIISEAFGSGDFSAIYGVVCMFLTVGMSIGAPMCAYVYDYFGSYEYAWIIFGVFSIVSMIGIMSSLYSLKKYRQTYYCNNQEVLENV